MKKLRWRDEEIIAFLEYKLHNSSINEREMDLYLGVKWNDVFDKDKYLNTYKSLQKQMKKLYIK